MAKQAKHDEDPVLANNRKAFHDYKVVETLEAGVCLVGTEVKSCRSRQVQLADGFARIENGEIWLYNVHIAPYENGGHFNHEAKRQRKLLLSRREIIRLAHNLKTKGGTLIPLKMYLKNGLVKLAIGYCLGKSDIDKRETIRKRDSEMEMRRLMK